MNIIEASIADLRAALEKGEATSVALVQAYLDRIEQYDRSGPCLNAVPVLNPDALAEAEASDKRREHGKARGPLDGIPYTAKNSYKVKGLTVAAGSPAFAELMATDDAFAIARLRDAGAILIGLTNMPPMANGGMQRGLYGRAESPYNADCLTAAFASVRQTDQEPQQPPASPPLALAKKHGPVVARLHPTTRCAPIPLVAGSYRCAAIGPWCPQWDVVVPHTRTMADMLEVLDVLVQDDPETRGDFWRSQPWVSLPIASQVRPASYAALANGSLIGKRFGVPAMYINEDAEAGRGENTGIGGSTGQKIVTRPSIMALWSAAKQALEQAGAEVITVGFPVVTNYEGDREDVPNIGARGLLPANYLHHEITDLSVWAWDDFLKANADPNLNRLADVDGAQIFPVPEGSLPDRYTGFEDDIADYPAHARAHPRDDFRSIPTLAEGLQGLEETRRRDLEDWMDELALDAVIFPAVADVGPADADTNPASADIAWRNGVWVANGNLAIRHLGIPTVTVPMGTMADIHMPVGLTFAGRGYSDNALLALACAFEATGPYRTPPMRTA